MGRAIRRFVGVAALSAASACSAATGTPAGSAPSPDGSSHDPAVRTDSARNSYTAADVRFMTGMIHHHAQALVISRMAPTRGASSSIRLLAERIINGQQDEIVTMQRWLRDRNEPVPEPASADTDGRKHGTTAPGDDLATRMPGMLSDEQLERLDAASGAEFDRLFLTYMIEHHQGAITMVDELFATSGAGRGEVAFRLASGIRADQASEIDRMQSMLREMLFETESSP